MQVKGGTGAILGMIFGYATDYPLFDQFNTNVSLTTPNWNNLSYL